MFAVLGVPTNGHALPQRTVCPLCRGDRFHVYDDEIRHAVWHHCFGCGASGDLVDLAASVWQLPLAEAAFKLTDCGIAIPPGVINEETVAKHVDKIVARRNRMKHLWAVAKYGLEISTRSAEMNRLMHRFHLVTNISPDRWRAGPGMVLGAMKCGVAELAFQPKSSTVSNTGRVDNPNTSEKVFPGRRWDEVLVVPYYDLPDRLSAFFFVGRHGNKEDMIVKTIVTSTNSRTEVGLAGLNCVLPRDSFNDTVVAVNDPLLMARIQVRYTIARMAPLPIVAYHHDATRWTHNAWRLLDGRKVVLWSWRLDAPTVIHAMKVNGHISLAAPEDLGAHSIDHYLRLCDASRLFAKVVRQARPWRDTVSKFLTTCERHEAEGLLLALKRNKVDVSDMRRELTAEASAVVGSLTGSPTERRVAVDGGVRTVEENGSLYWMSDRFGKPLTLVMNAYLRIDRIQIREGRTVYDGRLLLKGKELAFQAHQGHVDKNFGRFLETVAREHGEVLYVRSRCGGRRLLAAAMAFQKPITGSDEPEVGSEADAP